MSAKKSKTFFKTLTAILVLLLFFGGYYIYPSGIFGASVTKYTRPIGKPHRRLNRCYINSFIKYKSVHFAVVLP